MVDASPNYLILGAYVLMTNIHQYQLADSLLFHWKISSQLMDCISTEMQYLVLMARWILPGTILIFQTWAGCWIISRLQPPKKPWNSVVLVPYHWCWQGLFSFFSLRALHETKHTERMNLQSDFCMLFGTFKFSLLYNIKGNDSTSALNMEV